jgi:hypothetical protein
LKRKISLGNHKDLRRGHDSIQPFPAEPAQAKLIGEYDATGAKQRFQNR